MNKYLEKIAKKISTPMETEVVESKPAPVKAKPKKDPELKHHLRALAKLDKSNGLLIHHSTGSGKTKLLLRAIEKAQQDNPEGKAFVMAPSGLLSNIDKEILKHKITGINRDNLHLYSYQKALNDVNKIRKENYAIAVIDEAHNFRNPDAKRTKALKEIVQNADKRILTTATGNYNKLSDLSTVINMAAGHDVLPEDSAAMDRRYTHKGYKAQTLLERITGAEPQESVGLKNQHELANILEDYVDYYDSKDDPEAQTNFARVERKTIETEMSSEQAKYYKFAEGKIPWITRMKIRSNLPLDKKEKSSLNSFSTGVRQVSNGYSNLVEGGNTEYTPKILKATENLEAKMKKDPNFKALVYSNYLDSGVNEYSKRLKERGIKHTVYDGSLSHKDRDIMLKDYNEGKNNVMLISSAGSEGLDAKGTKLMQILEPHFNKAKIHQVEGRGRRFRSHTHLPEKEQKIEFEHYVTTHKKPLFGKAPYSIDKYLSENSDNKQQLFDQVKDLMKKHAQ